MTDPDRARICVVGSINMDLVVRAPRFPVAGETVLGGPHSVSPGGKGANQAVAAARAGAQVTLIGAVGDDEHGRALRALLAAESVDTTHVNTRPGRTGTAHITITGSGENTIIVAPGANATLSPQDVDAARNAIAQADILLLQLESPIPAAERAMDLAAASGTTIILNAAPAPATPSLVRRCDALIVNETEAAALTASHTTSDADRALALLATLGPRTSVLTRGALGAAFIHAKEPPVLVPANPVQAIDTVGAGDAFCGVFAVRMAEHQIGSRGSLDRMAIFDAACWACAAGSLATTRNSAIPSLPTRAEIVGHLRQTGSSPSE